MNRANILTKEEWPEWNINQTSPPVITIEGYHIQTVLSMIHTQLETLRKISSEQNRSINDFNKKDDKVIEKNNKIILKLQDKIEKLEEEIRNGETGKLVKKLNDAEERIQVLEEQLDMKASSNLSEKLVENSQQIQINERNILELQTLVESANLSELVEKLKKIDQQIKLLEVEKYDTHSRMMKLEDQACWYRNQAEKMNEEYGKLYENNEITSRELREFRDLLLNYERNRENGINGTDGSAGGSGGGGGHGAGNGGTGLTPFQENIIQSELNKLSNLFSNLDHKQMTLSSQYHSLEENYQQKLDKKMDLMKQWLMKYLKEALGNLNNSHGNGGDDNDQTDIGKVRCLVCNHVTKKVDSDTPYNKPDFRNTLGYLHDPHMTNTTTATGGGGGGGGYGTGNSTGQSYGGGAGNGYGDDGIVYRSGFKIPLKEYQESYKLKAMISPQVVTQGNSLQPPQSNRLIGSKFARIRAVPSPSHGQGGGGGTGTGTGEYLIVEDDPRGDMTNDILIQHHTATAPNTTGNSNSNYRPKTSEGVNSNFYKEMERYVFFSSLLLLFHLTPSRFFLSLALIVVVVLRRRYVRPSSAPGKKFRQGVR
jgi:hypothetical protein